LQRNSVRVADFNRLSQFVFSDFNAQRFFKPCRQMLIFFSQIHIGRLKDPHLRMGELQQRRFAFPFLSHIFQRITKGRENHRV
jgi:hypothetical protein